MEPSITSNNIPESKSKSHREVFLIISLAIILIIVNGYFFYKQFTKEVEVPVKILITNTENRPATSTPIEDSTQNTLLSICPEEWIDNQMPPVGDMKYGDQINPQYFILGGERREMGEFDIDWVNKNCKLEKQTVY